ncbi:hypothetical protein J1N35_025848 [Gossypium stocksii]|uniref:Uncharacterized protein n=1 Tax=Gossypium stocksii TaxID=47602 RepID=A0A9D3V7R2_9ROSI|nr:hypothetical protein J1N35_025848 [Gossypium stocksii]
MGKIIFEEVHRSAQKNVGSLNFPSICIALCQHVKVLVQANEDMIPNRGAIMNQIVIRFLRDEFPRDPPLDYASTSPTPTYAPTTLSTSTNVFEQQVLSSLRRLHMQFNLFEKQQSRIATNLGRALEKMDLL